MRQRGSLEAIYLRSSIINVSLPGQQALLHFGHNTTIVVQFFGNPRPAKSGQQLTYHSSHSLHPFFTIVDVAETILSNGYAPLIYACTFSCFQQLPKEYDGRKLIPLFSQAGQISILFIIIKENQEIYRRNTQSNDPQ